MTTLPDTATAAASQAERAERLSALCGVLDDRHPDDASPLCDFARLFFAKVPRQLLAERDTETLAAVIESAYRFLEDARPTGVDVQVVNPEDEAVPWSAPVTVIRAEIGDRPFIVDTIREYLSDEGLAIYYAIYPVIAVERNDTGEIVGVGRAEGGKLEAVIHCEVSRIEDAEQRAAVQAELTRRLEDVVEATTDFPGMRAALGETSALMDRYSATFPDRAEEFAEVREFLRWLERDTFVFLGFRAYDIIEQDGEQVMTVRPGSGLGILRDVQQSTYSDGVPLASMSEAFRERVTGGPLLLVSKANARSTVHRSDRLDYLGVKTLDEDGNVSGERRFLGLFTSKAYSEHAEDIPILRRKLNEILADTAVRPGSHDYKEIITIFNSMPKEALFQGSSDELEDEVQAVLGTLFSDEVRVLMRRDAARRGTNVMVILPRGKFSGDVRREIEATLAGRLAGNVLNYYLAMGAGDQARLHFYLDTPEPPAAGIAAELEREIADIARSWDDRFREQLAAEAAPGEVAPLHRLYCGAFSAEYRAATPPDQAVRDVLVMERMRAEQREETVDLRPLPPREGRDAVSALQLYVRERRVVLSDFMPILDFAGLRVIEVDTFSLAGEGLAPHMIYSFKVQTNTGERIPAERAPLLAEALLAARAGDTPSDHFAALVLRSGLRWREVDIIRSYANYAFQIGAIPSRVSAARGLAAYPELAGLLVELFRARFDPAAEEGERRTGELRGQLLRGLERIESLTDDRAFRKLVELIEATVRTNYFRHGGADPTFRSGGVPYLSFKIRDADVEELKKGGLLSEIYVTSARMEGIHLRGAPVSRGGIRWSDRPDDYRVEVLGLVQTQVVKNATIVPGGSKGGFVPLRRFPDRERMGEEAAEQYRTLIRGMLDLTDNLVAGEVVPPPDVVRHDGDDPYLVVAADKGTAHLSDTANEVAAEYGFWLGDAFASGGSHGYDHKEEGITARGAWECVKRHFRELNKDIQSEPFTVAGIGDMSGDVFGNGMLLSRQIRLLAAFDHRHVFIDPDPDPAASYAERERLFALPRSSWDDYDPAALSAGAMIVPRASKPTEVTPEARAALGLGDDVAELDGEELVRAVLRAPVELLWNGGIGTYVKHAEETHADVGDTSNDPVRVDARELRCTVVGEGGNLGFTQRARISFALGGGQINTDALDNSGGVDMSDHEVNLKILLGAVIADAELTMPERNRLLEAMTDEVSELVLANNAGQSLAVSLDELRSRERIDDFATLIRTLERAKRFDADRQELPSADTLSERSEQGIGVTRPSLCVLLAHAKLHAKEEILASTLPDDPAAERCLADYFPPSAVETAGETCLCDHRLHREIVTTMLVNELVNLMGAAFLHRVSQETGHSIAEVARAWMIASAISGTAEIRADLEPLETDHATAVVYRWLLGLGRVLEGTTRWALANVPPAADTGETIVALRDGLATLRGGFSGVVAGRDRAIYLERLAELEELGLQETLRERMVTLRFLPQLLEILALVPASGADALTTARAYYQVARRLELAALRQALVGQPREDPWERRHAVELVDDLGRAQRAITHAVLATPADSPTAALDRWEAEHEGRVQAYRELVAELGADAPLAAHAVAIRQLEALARADAAVAA